ncbi:MAG: UMP kinase [Legionellales bacterium]|nr:UMP kinase [Legionellales bacterium]|tara:strand:+ start:290 stop:1012 length:723 start_codon:yes stop_codon:yes gene_type:complete
MSSPIYKRVIIKLSGEALAGDVNYGIDPKVVDRIAAEISAARSLGVQIGLVLGGGNLFRGAELSNAGLGRITGDHMGMLATLMNALAMRDVFESRNIETRVMSAINMSGIVDHFHRRKAIYHLESGRMVIFAGGTGNPLVTTDSAASLRAIEVNADALLKATNVDGVFSSDPKQDPNAKIYSKISFDDVLDKELGVMDLNAFCQCRDYNMPLRVFNINKENALLNVLKGRDEGTLVYKEE